MNPSATPPSSPAAACGLPQRLQNGAAQAVAVHHGGGYASTGARFPEGVVKITNFSAIDEDVIA